MSSTPSQLRWVRDVSRKLVPDRVRHPVAVALLGNEDHWVRVVMNRDIRTHIASWPWADLDALEVSGQGFKDMGWRTYRDLQYPAFDLCAPLAEEEIADVTICEQVLEHVPDPITATRNLLQLLRPGGHLIVNTPFLVRIHGSPGDFWRFTPDGMRLLLRNRFC